MKTQPVLLIFPFAWGSRRAGTDSIATGPETHFPAIVRPPNLFFMPVVARMAGRKLPHADIGARKTSVLLVIFVAGLVPILCSSS